MTNFIKNIPGPLTMNQQTYRGDQLLGKFGSVFGRYTHAKYVNSSLYNSVLRRLRDRVSISKLKNWMIVVTPLIFGLPT